MATEQVQSQADLPECIPQDEIPIKLRCSICSRLAVNAYRLPCCEQAICEHCQNTLPDSCPVCAHEPVSPELCKPNKALRTTIKAFFKKREALRDKERGQKNNNNIVVAAKEGGALPHPVGGTTNDSLQPTEAKPSGGEASFSSTSMTGPHLAKLDQRDIPAPSIESPDSSTNGFPSTSPGKPSDAKSVNVREDGNAGKGEHEMRMRESLGNESMMTHKPGLDKPLSDVSKLDRSGNFFNANWDAADFNQMPPFMPGAGGMNNNMGNFPGVMGMPNMGFDPMTMSQNMYSGYSGTGMNTMNMGMNPMNTGLNFNAGQGGYGGWNNNQNTMWNGVNGMSNDFGPNVGYGGYNMPHGNYNHHQFPNNEFQTGYSGPGYVRGHGLGGRGYSYGYGNRGRGGYVQGNPGSYQPFHHHPQPPQKAMLHQPPLQHLSPLQQQRQPLKPPSKPPLPQPQVSPQLSQPLPQPPPQQQPPQQQQSQPQQQQQQQQQQPQPLQQQSQQQPQPQQPLQQQVLQKPQEPPSSSNAPQQQPTQASPKVSGLIKADISTESPLTKDKTNGINEVKCIPSRESKTSDSLNGQPQTEKPSEKDVDTKSIENAKEPEKSTAEEKPDKQEKFAPIESVLSETNHQSQIPSLGHDNAPIAPRALMAPPSAPLGPAAQFQGEQGLEMSGRGRGVGRGYYRGGFRGRGLGFFPGANFNTPFQQPSQSNSDNSGVTPNASKGHNNNVGQGVVGAPTAPKALREGLPNTGLAGIRGRGFSIVGRAAKSVPRGGINSSQHSRSASPPHDRGRDHSPSSSASRRRSKHRHRHRSRSQSSENEYDRRNEYRHHKSHNHDGNDEGIQNDDEPAPSCSSSTDSTSKRSRREEDRDHRNIHKHRSSHRSHRDKSRSRERRHRRKRSRSPTADEAEASTSAYSTNRINAGATRLNGERNEKDVSIKLREKERREKPPDRKRSRRDRSESAENSEYPRRHRSRRSRREEDEPRGSRKEKEREREKAAVSNEVEKDPHTIEREARNRERLLKEQQRREAVNAGTKRRDAKQNSGGRRLNYKYEDEDERARTARVEYERENARWK